MKDSREIFCEKYRLDVLMSQYFSILDDIVSCDVNRTLHQDASDLTYFPSKRNTFKSITFFFFLYFIKIISKLSRIGFRVLEQSRPFKKGFTYSPCLKFISIIFTVVFLAFRLSCKNCVSHSTQYILTVINVK